jgi:hypothetical protein
METKREKAKWTKAHKKLLANHSSCSESKGKHFQDHLELKSVKETVCKEDPEVFNLKNAQAAALPLTLTVSRMQVAGKTMCQKEQQKIKIKQHKRNVKQKHASLKTHR